MRCHSHHGYRVERETSFENGKVARATAQIASESQLQVFPLDDRAFLAQTGEGHHKTWRAIAALRTVVLDERLLHGMQSRIAEEAFGGHDMLASERVENRDAGIDRSVTELLAVQAADQDRASTAIALQKNHLGANKAQFAAKKIGQRAK